MFTLLAAATLAASLGTGQPHAQQTLPYYGYPGFAPDVTNGQLATLPPEDVTRVYTPGYSDYSGRLWIGEDVRDIRSRRATRRNPGKLAYGAADAHHSKVKVKVGSLVVSLSPWQQIEGEGWANFERGRQQWLAEHGYTGGVRTFVSPARVRAIQAAQASGAHASESKSESCEPSATIRLRKPNETGGRIKQVDSGVAGGLKIVAGDTPMRMSLPMTARAEVVERAIARGWVESEEETETKVANAAD
ncbi:hypothetical protein MNBD_PLANCTO03-962 [hydrothermal vent metagenome]|uniref:Uncharacterized protein n=1 Tax=hydrothermal vent metagenome TaxID=652676 RepID=A0A3B1E110_9ZZZZ